MLLDLSRSFFVRLSPLSSSSSSSSAPQGGACLADPEWRVLAGDTTALQLQPLLYPLSLSASSQAVREPQQTQPSPPSSSPSPGAGTLPCPSERKKWSVLPSTFGIVYEDCLMLFPKRFRSRVGLQLSWPLTSETHTGDDDVVDHDCRVPLHARSASHGSSADGVMFVELTSPSSLRPTSASDSTTTTTTLCVVLSSTMVLPEGCCTPAAADALLWYSQLPSWTPAAVLRRDTAGGGSLCPFFQVITEGERELLFELEQGTHAAAFLSRSGSAKEREQRGNSEPMVATTKFIFEALRLADFLLMEDFVSLLAGFVAARLQGKSLQQMRQVVGLSSGCEESQLFSVAMRQQLLVERQTTEADSITKKN